MGAIILNFKKKGGGEFNLSVINTSNTRLNQSLILHQTRNVVSRQCQCRVKQVRQSRVLRGNSTIKSETRSYM